jgi:hypothetical protein
MFTLIKEAYDKLKNNSSDEKKEEKTYKEKESKKEIIEIKTRVKSTQL